MILQFTSLIILNQSLYLTCILFILGPDPEVARNRLKERDGSFDERDLKKNIETQMDFIQELPATRVGNYSLYKVNDSGIFNNIYIIDNSRSIKETREQVEKWWDLVG